MLADQNKKERTCEKEPNFPVRPGKYAGDEKDLFARLNSTAILADQKSEE